MGRRDIDMEDTMSGISDETRAKWQAWLDSEPQEWKDLYAEIDARPPRIHAAPDDPLIEFVKNARPATVPMTNNEKAALERYHSRSVMRRQAAQGDPVAAAMLDDLAKGIPATPQPGGHDGPPENAEELFK
jgi:hypothetical protein